MSPAVLKAFLLSLLCAAGTEVEGAELGHETCLLARTMSMHRSNNPQGEDERVVDADLVPQPSSKQDEMLQSFLQYATAEAEIKEANRSLYRPSQLALSAFDEMKTYLSSMRTSISDRHATDQNAIEAAVDSVKECTMDHVVNPEALDSSLAAHEDCRNEQAGRNATKQARCSEFVSQQAQFAGSLPSCELSKVGSAGETEQAEFRECLKDHYVWVGGLHEHLEQCEAAEADLDSQAEQCDQTQLDLEVLACDLQDGFCVCQSRGLADYGKLREEILVKERRRKADFESTSRLECLLDFLHSNLTDDANFTELVEACAAEAVELMHLSIDYGHLPEEEVDKCDVGKKPCSQEWLSTYDSQISAMAPASQCRPCPTRAPTPAPTTAPTESEGTTPVPDEQGCASQWNNQACTAGQFGNEECYTCGERIEWLISAMGFLAEAAKRQIALEFFQACSKCGGSQDADLQSEGYEVVWQDEFDSTGSTWAVDASKWRSVVRGDGFGNDELQFYTNRSDNAWVSNGTLKIRARHESYMHRDYTSAKLESTADWQYGKFHIRSRLIGTARGTWAAHWMLPSQNAYGIWPHSGEIDIMEHVGYDSGKFHGTVHTGAYHHSIGTQIGGSVTAEPLAWHTWTVEWRPDLVLFAVDDEVYQVFRKEGEDPAVWPFDQKFYIILNLAVGGGWGGQQGIDVPAFDGDGQIFEVDWVRVEQRAR